MIVNKIKGRLSKFKESLPHVQKRYKSERDKKYNEAYLRSSAYDELMNKGYNPKISGNEAEVSDTNYVYRHKQFLKILGCWRWYGLYENKQQILDIVNNGTGIDFGGAAGPVRKETTIVDFSEKDIFERKVKYNDLSEVDFKVDYIFSSHTLEHIPDLKSIFTNMNLKLSEDGDVIFHLPAYTCVRWRNGVHKNKKFNDHHWTFFLKADETKVNALNLSNTLAIDEYVSQFFDIKKVSYCGDNSIMIFAKKKKE